MCLICFCVITFELGRECGVHKPVRPILHSVCDKVALIGLRPLKGRSLWGRCQDRS